jgi:hypothetical protein
LIAHPNLVVLRLLAALKPEMSQVFFAHTDTYELPRFNHTQHHDPLLHLLPLIALRNLKIFQGPILDDMIILDSNSGRDQGEKLLGVQGCIILDTDIEKEMFLASVATYQQYYGKWMIVGSYYSPGHTWSHSSAADRPVYHPRTRLPHWHIPLRG